MAPDTRSGGHGVEIRRRDGGNVNLGPRDRYSPCGLGPSGGQLMLAGRRVLIDASMVTQGGGYTYLVNMVPLLSAAAPEATFLVLVRSPSLIDLARV